MCRVWVELLFILWFFCKRLIIVMDSFCLIYFYNSSRVIFLKRLPSSASWEGECSQVGLTLPSSTMRWEECVDRSEGKGYGWNEQSIRCGHQDDGTE